VSLPFALTSLSYFPDETHLAIGSMHGHWFVLDALSGTISSTFSPYESKFGNVNVGTIAVSPDGSLVLTGVGLISLVGQYVGSAEAKAWESGIEPVKIWRAADGAQVATFPEAQLPIRQALWDPLNRFVAFVDNDATLFIWQPTLSAAQVKLVLPRPTLSIAITSNGQRIAVATGEGVWVYQID
jgi:WD40 repeat protein